MAASAGLQAAGAIEQGQAQSKAAAYQAQVATNNATIAKENANYATAAGEQSMVNQQKKTKATIGAITAGQGANNLDVNSGSDLQVRTSAAQLGQLDALTIKNNAARTAWNEENQASSYTAQSQLDTSESKSSSLAGFINAGNSVLGGASSIGKLYWPGAGAGA